MRTLFISDLHLEDSQQHRTELLLAFLRGPALEADALYILGDLFEFWIGDDAPAAAASSVAEVCADLAGSGVPCYFMHGNRDFLLGEDYAALAGFRLLPESCVVDLYGTATLLLHGDTLCTDDVEYQAFRRQARDPLWQARVLALPIEERLQLARNARDASMAHTGSSAAEIMDVNAEAVADALRRNGVRRMIHGHTHRPAFHRFELDGSPAERIVLADWYANGSYLEVSKQGTQAITL
jgi:UDP-2,3-diacylglucosamine hydrolase